MQRNALIVLASDSDKVDDPPGITADSHHVTDWLRSNGGGAWELEEIHTLRSPSADELHNYRRIVAEVDYSVLVFFGHGRQDPNDRSDVLLKINPREELPLSQFTGSTRFSMRLIDTCRSAVPEELLEGITKVAAAPQIFIDHNRSKHRDMFDAEMGKCEYGCATLLATGPSQDAYATSNGGRFTSSLVGAGQIWRMTGYSSPKVMTMEEAFNQADHLTRQHEPPQYPEFRQDGGASKFPFAVLAK